MTPQLVSTTLLFLNRLMKQWDAAYLCSILLLVHQVAVYHKGGGVAEKNRCCIELTIVVVVVVGVVGHHCVCVYVWRRLLLI